jgi:hypothetical protein
MIAGIGPVKPFLFKNLIAHSQACGRVEDGPPTRSRCAGAATHAPGRRRARQREGDACLLRNSSKPRGRAAVGDAQVRERGQRGDCRRHAAGEAVLLQVPAPQRARSARPSRPGDRTGGGAAYRSTSLVSAVMLARIGPVKPFLYKYLIAHSEARGRTKDGPPTRTRCAGAATAPHRRRGRPREGDAQLRERGQRGDRRRHAAD